jgi:hypothetical protein
MVDSFVKTLKRDHVRVSAIPDVPLRFFLWSIAGWRTTTPCIRICDWDTHHLASTSFPNPLRLRFNEGQLNDHEKAALSSQGLSDPAEPSIE